MEYEKSFKREKKKKIKWMWWKGTPKKMESRWQLGMMKWIKVMTRAPIEERVLTVKKKESLDETKHDQWKNTRLVNW